MFAPYCKWTIKIVTRETVPVCWQCSSVHVWQIMYQKWTKVWSKSASKIINGVYRVYAHVMIRMVMQMREREKISVFLEFLWNIISSWKVDVWASMHEDVHQTVWPCAGWKCVRVTFVELNMSVVSDQLCILMVRARAVLSHQIIPYNLSNARKTALPRWRLLSYSVDFDLTTLSNPWYQIFYWSRFCGPSWCHHLHWWHVHLVLVTQSHRPDLSESHQHGCLRLLSSATIQMFEWLQGSILSCQRY